MSVPTTGRAGAPFASLMLQDVEGSLIVAGQVAGPAHITGVKRSVVVVAARQVRLHECRDVDFYLWAGSRVIVEDCEGVRVAPIPEIYVSSLLLLFPCLWRNRL